MAEVLTRSKINRTIGMRFDVRDRVGVQTPMHGDYPINTRRRKSLKDLFWFTIKITNFCRFHEFNQNSYDPVADVLLVHNC